MHLPLAKIELRCILVVVNPLYLVYYASMKVLFSDDASYVPLFLIPPAKTRQEKECFLVINFTLFHIFILFYHHLFQDLHHEK